MPRLDLVKSEKLYQSEINHVSIYKGSINHNATPVAIKEQVHASLNEANRAIQEAMNQIQLSHESVCKVYDCFFEDLGGGEVKSVIIMELMDTDLSSEIVRRAADGVPWSEAEVLEMAKELVRVLLYAKEKGVSHRDIKPQNVFLSGGKVKIGDFGSSASNLQINAQVYSLQGSPFYLAPELKIQYLSVLEGTGENVPYDPFKSDIYSLGITLLSMIRLKTPLELANLGTLREMTEMLIIECREYPHLQEIIRRMLEIGPQNRISFEELSEVIANLERPPCDKKPIEYPQFERSEHLSASDGDLKQCEKCGKFILPLDSIEPKGDRSTVRIVYCQCAISQDQIEPQSPFCERCQKPLLLSSKNASKSTGSLGEVYCVCEQERNHLEKCSTCSQPILQQAWVSEIPDSLLKYADLLNTFCSLKCLEEFDKLASGEADIIGTCVSCSRAIFQVSITKNIAIRLECGHVLHDMNCFYTYLKRASNDFRHVTRYICPLCDLPISFMTLEPIFGKRNLRKFRDIPSHRMCTACKTGLELIRLPCGHAYCIDCAIRDNGKRCEQCPHSHCSTF